MDSYFPTKWPNGYPKRKNVSDTHIQRQTITKINHDRRTALERSVKSISLGLGGLNRFYVATILALTSRLVSRPAGGTNDACSIFTFRISSLSLSNRRLYFPLVLEQRILLENLNVSSAGLITSWGLGFGQNLSPLPRRRKKLCIFGYSKCAKRRFRSDCAYARV